MELKAEKTRIVHLGRDEGLDNRWVRAKRNKDVVPRTSLKASSGRGSIRDITARSHAGVRRGEVNRSCYGIGGLVCCVEAQIVEAGALAATRGQPFPVAERRTRRCATAESAVAGSAACRPVKGIGEPDEGEPHVRFEVAGAGDAMAVELGTTGKPAWNRCASAYGSHRASP